MANDPQQDLSALKDLAERFAERELAPNALERDRFPFVEFDRAVVDKAASIGLLAPTVPEAHGGSGLNMTGLAVILESLARHDASVAAVIFVQTLARHFMASITADGFDPKWRDTPSDGSNLLALPIYADPDEPPEDITVVAETDGFTLSGNLDYVACLPVARAAIVPADLDGRLHMFLVETDQPGVAFGEPVASLGLRACPVADLVLDQVKLPLNNHLGNEKNLEIFQTLADLYRGPLTAMALGIMRSCYVEAFHYAAERYQAKKQIIEHDMIKRMLADMLAWIELGKAGLALVCQAADQDGSPLRTPVLSVQELVTRAASQAATDSVQILGGYGYMHEYGQEKRMRDAKQLQAVFGGSPIRTLRILESAMEGS